MSATTTIALAEGALIAIGILSLGSDLADLKRSAEDYRLDELRREAEAAVYNANVTPIDRGPHYR